ncbi:MAG: single-stranded DNA-binding protein [Robiginitomaculum sp.]|nr:MAG: single-stranded DNA-binding protein [Robiginitomaculum sp.]
MAGSLNKVMLIGNLGKDPEIRAMGNGGKVCSFSIATSESWKDKQSGERRDKTEWHNIVIFNEHLIRVVENYVKKGSKVYIEGALQTRKWTDREGATRYTTEVVLQRFNGELTMLDSRNSGGGGGYGGGQESGGGYNQDNGNSGGSRPASAQEGPTENFDLDDDIPF